MQNYELTTFKQEQLNALAPIVKANEKICLDGNKAFNLSMSKLLIAQVEHSARLARLEEAYRTSSKEARTAEKRYSERLRALADAHGACFPHESAESHRAFALEKVGTKAEVIASAFEKREESRRALMDWKKSNPSPCEGLTRELKALAKGVKSIAEARTSVKKYFETEYSVSLNTPTLEYLLPQLDKKAEGSKALKEGSPVQACTPVQALAGIGHRILAIAIKSNCTSEKWITVAERLATATH